MMLEYGLKDKSLMIDWSGLNCLVFIPCIGRRKICEKLGKNGVLCCM